MDHKDALARSALACMAATALAGVPIMALEIGTHVLVNRHAVDEWTYLENGVPKNRLDQVLRDRLGYENDREATFNERTVQEWIELGGELEDEGWPILPKTGRYYNHFHDPLQPWDSAGLTFLGPNESAARWMQNRRQEGTGAAGGNWSWHDARRTFYQALTQPDSARRDALERFSIRWRPKNAGKRFSKKPGPCEKP